MKLEKLTQAKSFKTQLAQLTSYRKDYHDLPNVLNDFLVDIVNEKALVESTVAIQKSGGMAIHKVRIKRKGMGSSGGYRLIFSVFYPEMKVQLLSIYPKSGKYGKTNADKEELKQLIKDAFL